MLTVTAGGWISHCGPRGVDGPIEDLPFPIQHGVLFHIGHKVLSPFLRYRADRMDSAGFEAAARALRTRTSGLFGEAPTFLRWRNAGACAIPSMDLRLHMSSASQPIS